MTANLLKRVATNVAVEPRLQPLTGERLQCRTAITDDQARLDVAASGVWGGRFERVFLDVRVFNPFAQSNRTSSLISTYQRHEKEKRRHHTCQVLRVLFLDRHGKIPGFALVFRDMSYFYQNNPFSTFDGTILVAPTKIMHKHHHSS